ncbi:MAG: DNA starvation/stationary phase protection protein Dps [Gemmataceae bacterium]
MATATTQLHKTKIDIVEDKREALVELLQARLVDAIDVQLQSKQAHWNVKGPHFIGLHELFDQVHDHAEDWVDLIAERAVILGGTVDGTPQTVASGTNLPAYPTDIKNGADHVDAFSTALATFGKHVREAIAKSEELEDMDTADLFTEVSRAVDKDLWFVEAHQQADK